METTIYATYPGILGSIEGEGFEQLLESPSYWDEILATQERYLAAADKLKAMPETAMRNIRLAQIYFLEGDFEKVDKQIRFSFSNPLSYALSIAICFYRQETEQALYLCNSGLEKSVQKGIATEARARLLYLKAKLHLKISEPEKGRDAARLAIDTAKSIGMIRFVDTCQLVVHDCQLSLEDIVPLEQYEDELVAFIEKPTSREGMLEAYQRLTRLQFRQGLYSKSLRTTINSPRAFHGEGFLELGLLLNQLDTSTDWKKLESSKHYGRLRSLRGLIRADANSILEGPAPDKSAGLDPRPFSEWCLSYAWALMKSGQLDRASSVLGETYVQKSEWDLRLIRCGIITEMFLIDPVKQMDLWDFNKYFSEAISILTHKVRLEESIVLKGFLAAYPNSGVLMASGLEPSHCLRKFIDLAVGVFGPNGIRIRGINHPMAKAMIEILRGQTPKMNSGAARMAKTRLKTFLQERGNPLLVSTFSISEKMDLISGLDTKTESVLKTFRLEHGL